MSTKRKLLGVVGLGLGALAVYGIRAGIRALNYPVQINGPETPDDFGLEYEDVRFTSRGDHVPLDGWLCPVRPSRGTIIFGHGYAGSKEPDLPVARWLVEAGFTVLLFDFRGHGRSPAHRVTLGYYESRDLLGAVDFVRASGEERIGVLGFSMGAATGILAAAAEPAIRALVADNGFATLHDAVTGSLEKDGTPHWLAQVVTTVTMPFSHAVVRYPLGSSDPIKVIGRIAPRPVLIIHGQEDRAIGVNNAHRLFAAAREPKQLLVFPGADHAESRFTDPDAYRRAIVEHFARAFA